VALSYQAGANSYVIKPLEYKDFFEAVQRIITTGSASTTRSEKVGSGGRVGNKG
jgi:FixJ family two-component response regulator